MYRPAEACGVPFSCCRNESMTDAFFVSNTQCGYNARRKNRIFWGEQIWTEGCTSKFLEWVKNNHKPVVGVVLGVGICQVIKNGYAIYYAFDNNPTST